MRILVTAALFISLHCFSVLIFPSHQAEAAEVDDVNVRNFPETQQIRGDVQVINFPATQQIRGSVSVDGMTKFIAKDGLIVPPSQRAELNEMVYAGTIDTDGFTSLMIALQGEMRSDVFFSGTIGVLLVPDEKPILRILRDAKRVQYPIECKALSKLSDSVYFESEQVQQRIAFSRYKMFLYNTTNKQAEANVYLYLSNAPTVIVQERSNK
jgi:hypothetical protein